MCDARRIEPLVGAILIISVNGSNTAPWVHPLQAILLNLSDTFMKALKFLVASLAISTLLLSLTACSGMSRQDRNTAIGAGAGAVGGSILTGGSTIGTVGGAAVGGVIGHETSKP